MSDRINSLVSENAATSADRQTSDIAPLGGCCPREAGAGRHLNLVATASLPCDASAATPAEGGHSHLARLIKAVQKSQRLKAAKLRRRYLHLV